MYFSNLVNQNKVLVLCLEFLFKVFDLYFIVVNKLFSLR
jgi:hypothetical protein